MSIMYDTNMFRSTNNSCESNVIIRCTFTHVFCAGRPHPGKHIAMSRSRGYIYNPIHATLRIHALCSHNCTSVATHSDSEIISKSLLLLGYLHRVASHLNHHADCGQHYHLHHHRLLCLAPQLHPQYLHVYKHTGCSQSLPLRRWLSCRFHS